MSELLRIERKVVLRNADLAYAESIILTHALGFSETYAARQISNIYLDTLDREFYSDHLSGVSDRYKWRFRSYDGQAPWILEKKFKMAGLGGKNFYPEKTIPDSFICGTLTEPIIIDNRALLPVLKNSFTRRYFQSAQNHIRVTLDTNLTYDLPASAFAHFDHDVAAILEVKFPVDQNKEGITFLQSLPWLSTQFSKYVRGTQILGTAL